jgi:predicted nuclease with TOPRIM domain
MIAEARDLFAQRERLEAELAAVNERLAKLKAQYMERTRIWGIRDERFRHEINKLEDA